MTTLKVNGVEHHVDVPDDTPLLWILRDEMDLTGTKFGCGMGLCGACTVHVDGAPMRACQLPLSAVANKNVTTIEGLGKPTEMHVVQLAWQKESVPQCGYCQSGQIMSAAALLRTKHNPSDADIDAAMSGNICRCGTYDRIRQAIHTAAAMLRTGEKA